MASRSRPTALGLAFALAASLLSSVAMGQQATALDRFEPAPAGDALFALPDPGVSGRQKPAFGALLSYAHAPLRVTHTAPSGETSRVALVRYQLIGHALGSLELGRLAKLEVDVPVTLSQSGDSYLEPGAGAAAAASISAPSGASLNDLRAGVRLPVFGRDGGALQGAVALSAWFPTGNEQRFAGAPGVRLAPSLLLGGESGPLVWRLFASRRGLLGDGEGRGLLDGELLAGGGVALRTGVVQVGPELYASGAPSRGDIASRTVGAEALLGVRARLGPVELGLAGGPGLGHGVGTPAFRLLAGAQIAADLAPPPPSREPATGGHASPDAPGAGGQPGDSTRNQPGGPLSSSGGSAPDRDGDGVPDASDACPDRVGEAGGKRPGCPPDRDGDGVFDLDDRCPDQPGAPSVDPARHGCPADTDGDGVPDDLDACPREKGEPSSDPKASGCPKAVRVDGGQIVILQQVNFTTGKDAIDPSSFGLLQQVAGVLAEHPEIARVAVDGHTDNVGADRANLSLSQRRAVAVVRWLIDKGGVDARRLEARGFGARRPIADNKSAEGRAKNRRVEFLIRKRTPDGAAGWRDGPVD